MAVHLNVPLYQWSIRKVILVNLICSCVNVKSPDHLCQHCTFCWNSTIILFIDLAHIFSNNFQEV